ADHLFRGDPDQLITIVGMLVTRRLLLVPHINRAETSYPARLFRFARFVFFLFNLAEHRSKNHDTFFAFPDLPSKRLPGLIACNSSGVRTLLEDKKHVEEGIGPKLRHRSQITRECLTVTSIQRFHELLDRLICNFLDVFRIHFFSFRCMKVGSFTREQEPNRNRFTGRTSFSCFRPERMATSVTETVFSGATVRKWRPLARSLEAYKRGLYVWGE